ncbi:MAG: DNA-binding response regulator [Phycisphaerae bacterium]|jgi:CheY-like chemotaxis protein
MSCYKALVVEDDPQTVDSIVDALSSIEHEHDVVPSQQEALRRLKTDDYAYILSAIKIRVRAGIGLARIQNTENLLEKMPEAKDGATPPVILMSDYAVDGLKPTVDVMRLAMAMGRRGAVDVIAKPFPTAGRTLDRVIKKVLGLTNGNGGPATGDKAGSMPRLSDKGSASGGPTRFSQSVQPAKQTPPLPGDTSGDSVTLTKMQMDILESLTESPHQTLLQADIVEAGGYSKHTTRGSLKRLLALGLVSQPQGLRGGYAITEQGRKLLGQSKKRDS